MNQKRKGSNAERDIIHQLWGLGWGACRVAGSGSIKYPAPDIFAGKDGRLIVIEAKCTKSNNQYFSEQEVAELKQFAELVGAEPLFAIKFQSNPWIIIREGDLEYTGSRYGINKDISIRRGLLMEEAFR